MILPDVNLLIHAYNSESAEHENARKWWESRMAGPEGVGLTWVVVLGFIRITTSRRILKNPYPLNEILDIVGEWLELPHYDLVHPGGAHFTHLEGLLRKAGAAGNLTTDAHLAATAIERGFILYTSDADFSRFPGLKWRNPLKDGDC
ncbi:MAG: type II toxin-antitoxin system VapC family toxin [Terrimicrobiaceae bacterium]|nr:type II toxin-antitoxin system VapC family toxin [Terrimicrobiaceae bacterium]